MTHGSWSSAFAELSGRVKPRFWPSIHGFRGKECTENRIRATPSCGPSEDYSGVKVADPYRWLEQLDSPETRAWVAAEAKLTDTYLAKIAARQAIKKRLTTLLDFEKFGVPFHQGTRYFYPHNRGLQEQSVLDTTVALPGLGTVSGFDGEPDERETFYSYTDLVTPATIYRLDLETGASTIFRAPKVAFNPRTLETKQVFYPATLIVTGDHDTRVMPAHSFKFAAALQAAQAGRAPILLRVQLSAGHGGGPTTSQFIDETADADAFLLENLAIRN